jgi:hypothetical protein
MSKKNNLNFNNVDCQTFTSRLYNLNYNPDYIIYKLKQTGPKPWHLVLLHAPLWLCLAPFSVHVAMRRSIIFSLLGSLARRPSTSMCIRYVAADWVPSEAHHLHWCVGHISDPCQRDEHQRIHLPPQPSSFLHPITFLQMDAVLHAKLACCF